jgi:hypothetical protein
MEKRVMPSSCENQEMDTTTHPAGKPGRKYIMARNNIFTPKMPYITSEVTRMNLNENNTCHGQYKRIPSPSLDPSCINCNYVSEKACNQSCSTEGKCQYTRNLMQILENFGRKISNVIYFQITLEIYMYIINTR